MRRPTSSGSPPRRPPPESPHASQCILPAVYEHCGLAAARPRAASQACRVDRAQRICTCDGIGEVQLRLHRCRKTRTTYKDCARAPRAPCTQRPKPTAAWRSRSHFAIPESRRLAFPTRARGCRHLQIIRSSPPPPSSQPLPRAPHRASRHVAWAGLSRLAVKRYLHARPDIEA